MSVFRRIALVVLTPLLVFPGCTTLELFKTTALHFTSPFEDEGRGYYKVGDPYQVAGRWYHPQEDHDYEETGVASWYGSDFHRKKTANGEIFDKNALTAAHRTLPLPSVVRVENLENGRSVMLRVNDRGPFADDRIIDVSEKAAKMLGFQNQGTARVRVIFDRQATERMFAELGEGDYSRPKKTESAPAPAPRALAFKPALPPRHFIQTGAYTDYQNAVKAAKKLANNGTQVQIANVREASSQKVYKVRIGPFDQAGVADKTLTKVHGLGFKDAILVASD